MSTFTAILAGLVLFIGLVAAATLQYRADKAKAAAYKETMDNADAITKIAQELTKQFKKEKKKWDK